MSAIDDASSFMNGIALGENLIGLFGADIEPDITGFDAPIGSLLFAPSYGLYRKHTAPTTGWAKIAGAAGFGYFSFSAGIVRQASEGDYLDLTVGVGMNEVPYVVPFDAEFVAMSLATDGPETWRLMTQYWDGLAWVNTTAYLDVTAADFANAVGYGNSAPAGTKLAFQIQNSTGNINRPRGFAFLRRA